jgi:hypothetical protein
MARSTSAHFVSPELVELRMRLSADVWAALERAMQGARRAAEGSMSDAEALAAVARDALAQQDQGDADPRSTVVLYECQHCQKTELETGREPMDLTPAEAARLGCGAKVVDLERAGRLVRRGGPLPAAVKNAVLLRDRCQCRVPGCRRRRYVDVHHIEAQSRGGEHSRKNCVALCSQHHRMLHEGKLQVEGDADREGKLTVRDEDGDPSATCSRPNVGHPSCQATPKPCSPSWVDAAAGTPIACAKPVSSASPRCKLRSSSFRWRGA